MSIPSLDFHLFKEGWWWGTVEITEAAVCSARILCLLGSRAWGSWGPISLTEEGGLLFWGGGRSWFLLNWEASLTSSPLMVINRAMHCWSSLTALIRTPVLAPDASAPTLSFPLAFISFHQREGGLLGWAYSLVILWWGYLTGSDLSLPGLAWDCEWDWPEEAAARIWSMLPC